MAPVSGPPADPPTEGGSTPRGVVRPVSDPAAVADILASIRSIVSEENRRFERSPVRRPERDDVLLLTPAMRIDIAPERAGAHARSDRAARNASEAAGVSMAEAQPPARLAATVAETASAASRASDPLAELVRSVLREEIEGAFGERVVARVREVLERDDPAEPGGR